MAYRTYTVTCTPPLTGAAWNDREYQVEVFAKSAADAVKKARSDYRDENGRFAPAYTYRAKLATEQE
jgi:hypothetical protein